MRRLLYPLWAVALLVAVAFIWRGIVAAMGNPVHLGYLPGRFIEYEEESHVREQSKNGPLSGDWEYVRVGKVRVQALRVEVDGTIELLEGWKREVPRLSKYLSNELDMLPKFGKTFAQQLHVDPCVVRRRRLKPTGDPTGEAKPEDLDGALETVFRRARILPGGRVDVGHSGNWRERIGPLTVKFEWKVARREPRGGRSCLVYEVSPTAVLAVKAESMPNFMGSIVWHTGPDEGYVTTKGSVVTTWLSDDEHIPIAIETHEKVLVVPQKWVSQFRETRTKLTLSREDFAQPETTKDAEAFARAEEIAREGKTEESIAALRAILGSVWKDWATARAEALTSTLSLVGRPCPSLPEGTWKGDTPKTLRSLQGRVVLIDIWLLRVAPCMESMKVVKSIAAKYRARGLYVVGLTYEEPQNESEQINKYLADALIDYPTLIADTGVGDVLYHVKTMPYCLLVDRKGVVRWTGSPTDPALEAQIESLLRE